MPHFSPRSLDMLNTCHPKLQAVCKQVIRFFDFTVIEGHRGASVQNRLHRMGKSKLQFPDSKHNRLPSMAVDLAPCPIDWADEQRFIYLAGIMKGTAIQMGITLRWGGDWDGDTQLKDNRFNDYPHFELVNE